MHSRKNSRTCTFCAKNFYKHNGMCLIGISISSTKLELSYRDFENRILFLEDIPDFYTPENLTSFFDWLRQINALQKLNGIILGKTNKNESFEEQKKSIVNVVSEKYGLDNLPILYGLNFGHSSPICVLPYGAKAEIKCYNGTFLILESGVL